MTGRVSAVVGGAVLIGAVAWSFRVAPATTPAGAIVFVRGPAAAPGTADPGLGEVQVLACVSTEDGLRVTGHVAVGPTVSTIMVLGAHGSGAGLATSAGRANALTARPRSEGGDFQVTIPWADASARFAVVDAGTLSDSQGSARVGAAAACPGAADHPDTVSERT